MGSILRAFAMRLNPGREVPSGPLAIDWLHPLTRGLVACYVPGVMGGCDLVGSGPQLGFESVAALGSSQEGGCLAAGTAANSSMHANATPPLLQLGDMSLYYRGELAGTSTQVPFPIGISFNNAVASPFIICSIAGQSTGWGTIQVTWNSNGVQVSGPTFDLTGLVGSTVSLGACFPINGNVLFYVNGIQKSSTAFGATASTKGTGPIVSLNVLGTLASSRSSNANCYVGYFWNRALSADELAWIDREPYSFLIPAEYEMPALFIVSAPVLSAVPLRTLMGVGT